MHNPRILLIIPAYNEAANLGGVLEEIRREAAACDILVVNDCSSDATLEVCTRYGVRVTTTVFNLGIGGAVQTGYKYAAAHYYDIAIQVDGDGQHPADQIARLVKALLENGADMVIGSRYLEPMGYELQYPRFIGTTIFSFITSVIIGRKITDVTSGFRAANARTIKFLSVEYPEDFPDVEAVILLGLSGFRLEEIPLRMRRRTRGHSSITFQKSAVYCFTTIISILSVLLRKHVNVNDACVTGRETL